MNGDSGDQHDRFETFDAAYVLGALSAEERIEFERHLHECPSCARSVQDMAGLPGLLALAEPGGPEVDGSQPDGSGPAGQHPVPPAELRGRLSTRVRRARLRRTAIAIGSVAVAIAACIALVLVLTVPGSGPTEQPEIAMTPLGSFPVRASVTVLDQPWGATVEMSCWYSGNRSGDYVLVALGRDGGLDRLARWHAMPEQTAEVSVGTDFAPGEIKAVEVRTSGGTPLLRMHPSG